MCGIVGFFSETGFEKAEAEKTATAMSDAIRHRGPDAAGVWVDQDVGLVLAHRRLSIIDVSEAGAQPMVSASGRYVISYNGEIYNFEDLRSQLNQQGQNPEWRGHSDTEVLLGAIDAWGVEAVLPKLNGMFAFGLWDRKEQALWLARDRFGEKPLYYGRSGNVFLFASELKAFGRHPGFRPQVDPNALSAFVKYGFVPHVQSIYQGIRKLPPGGWVRISAQTRFRDIPDARLFWDIDDVVTGARKAGFDGDLASAADRLDELLGKAVSARMVSDVPLGGLLSGGLDSSLIVAMMQAHSSRPVSTFSIGNAESGYDEAAAAKQIAEHLGTHHTEFYVDPADALKVIPQLGRMYDEPFADSSQIPTHVVSRLVRQSGTVALSGDCGDELFGGYNRYVHGGRIARLIGALPYPLRRSMALGVTMMSPGTINALVAGAGRIFPSVSDHGAVGEKIHKLARAFSVRSEAEFREFLLALWPEPQTVLLGDAKTDDLSTAYPPPRELQGFAETMMYTDTRNYMSDDILAKVDRASMAASLEVRVPFLDPEVFAFAWSLPMNFKIANGQGKLLLRRLLSRYVPPALFDRPKHGFSIPVGRWLRGELRDWAESLLSAERLDRDGFFDGKVVREYWDAHLSGRRDHDARLWTILMFQAWLDENSSPGIADHS